jgi:hypothetical protein
MSKEQNQPSSEDQPHPHDHRPATSSEAPLNAHTICFPSATASLQMEVDGIEPTTPCLQSRCSPTELHPQETQTDESSCFFCARLGFKKKFFLARKNQRTLINASQRLVGQGGFEPPTPRLSSVCSNQLSYWPNTSEQAERDASTKTGECAPEPVRLVAGKGYVDGAQSGSDQSDRHRHPPVAYW